MADNFTNLNYDNAGYKNLTRFNGFYDNIYKEPLVNGTGFVFMTRPQLFIDPYKPTVKDTKRILAYNNMLADPIFTQYIKSESINPLDIEIVKALSYNSDYSKSQFLPFITNECKEFSPIGVSMEQMDAFETKNGYRQTLPTHKVQSDAAGTFDIQVVEDGNMSFIKTLTLWVKYIENISNGVFAANPDMVLNGTLDYVSSLYFFMLEPDGKTLKYWEKYTGCWPTIIPYDALKLARAQQDITELNITFQYMTRESMNPKILEDFNKVSFNLLGISLPDYIIDNSYASVKQSPLLNKEVMLRLEDNKELNNISLLLNAKERDPIILFKDGNNKGINPDSVNGRFELIFDDNGYKSEFLESVMGDENYYLNDVATNDAKETSIEQWNMTDFWGND